MNDTDQEIKRDELGRFVPGNPGGPGRPRGMSIRQIIIDKLQKRYLTDTADITRAEAMVDKYLDSIENGEKFNNQSFEFIIEQVDGRAKQTQEVTGIDGSEITLKVEIVKPDESK